VSNLEPQAWNRYGKEKHIWEYVELGDRRKSWAKFRRVIFCRPLQEDGQLLLDFARRETVLYTNLGMGGAVDEALGRAGMQDLLEPPSIIASYHHRGSDELIHRALKDFGFEELPFKRFAQNAAFYYTMPTAFFLYECFKEDVCAPEVGTAVYATTVRRKLIDVAAKIIRHAGKIILKVTAAAWDALHFEELWRRSGKPPQFMWV
jgi:hypothetical protein